MCKTDPQTKPTKTTQSLKHRWLTWHFVLTAQATATLADGCVISYLEAALAEDEIQQTQWMCSNRVRSLSDL